MLYTLEQLLKIYSSSQVGWVFMRNDARQDPAADVSTIKPAGGAIKSDGTWKLHISIDPQDMLKAIPIIYREFTNQNTPSMGMKIASSGLLAQDHQSGKEVALIFDKATEDSAEGHKKILLFLYSLATKFESAGIQPEAKPPLTINTEELVRLSGSTADRENLEQGKYDAAIKFKADETLSYFNYRDEMALIFDDDDYHDLVSEADPAEKQRMVKRSEFNNLNCDYKHNPLKRENDFLYGVVLERDISLICKKNSAATDNISSPQTNEINIEKAKKDFLADLSRQLKKPGLTRAEILTLFAQIKDRNGDYKYIHQQRNPRWDRIRLFFKSAAQKEHDFWHTATYQQAVKLLKNAYLATENTDHSDSNRKDEADALIDYIRGNSPFHLEKTSSRKSMK